MRTRSQQAEAHPMPPHPSGKRSQERRRGLSDGIAVPAALLGVGLGGFVDGIVLHQILQWHHMVSPAEGYPATTVRGLEVNTLWDGLFHAVAYLFVLAGLVLLGRRHRGPGSTAASSGEILGWALVGWGVFNLVEGIINHHLLGIHHVRSGPHQLAYDLGFLALGVSLLLVGWLLARPAFGGKKRNERLAIVRRRVVNVCCKREFEPSQEEEVP
jgi:uncharacterized membrane protein